MIQYKEPTPISDEMNELITGATLALPEEGIEDLVCPLKSENPIDLGITNELPKEGIDEIMKEYSDLQAEKLYINPKFRGILRKNQTL